ncbi:MAG: DUF4249 family protein [Chitinophagaceae bacterium]
MPVTNTSYKSRLQHPYKWILPVLLVFGACKKDFTSGQFIDDKLVVLAEITAPDSLKVPIGKTIKVGGGGIIRFEKVNDASVIVTEDNVRSWVLQPNWSSIYASNPTSVFTNRHRLKYATTYSIEIKHLTLGTAKATTTIPPLPTVSIIDTSFIEFQGRPTLAVDFKVTDDSASTNYYVIEAVKENVKLLRYFIYRNVRYDYDTQQGKTLFDQVHSTYNIKLQRDTVPQAKFTRLYMYTTDPITDNADIDNLQNAFRRIFIAGNSIKGQSYVTKVYIDRSYFKTDDPAQKGRVRIQFKAVSKELYDYLLAYEKYKTEFGSLPAGQLNTPNGNIQNGLGVFGGSARRERIVYFDVLW